MPNKEQFFLALRYASSGHRGTHEIVESWPDKTAPEDIQAALTVLGRRRLEYEDGDSRRLNLRYANLRGLDLKSAHLEGADLEGANLQDTDFTEACLCGAQLRRALIYHARLDRADLRRADLTDAILLNNRTLDADVREAILEGVRAPEHEHHKKSLGFDDADARGAIIDGWADPLAGAVVPSADSRDISAQKPFPSAKSANPCLQRSALVWVLHR